MTTNNLFSTKQYGFITGQSTTLQLLKVLDKLTEIVDLGGQIDVIYMDFMKAFDQVPNFRLIEKVRSYGIDGSVLGWIRNFLTERSHRVVINNSNSTWAEVTSGIPQGSVLGPILFVIYINDLPSVVVSPAYLFADDTKLFREVSTTVDQHPLQADLDALQDWSNKWLLKFHPDKCKLLIIGKRKLQTQFHLNSTGGRHNLECVNEMKDLGVTIDSNLTFESHIQEKVNKANRMVGLIRRTFMFLDESTFSFLFKAFVRPHIEYANSVWNPHKRKDIIAIENVHRRATKLVPSLKDMCYSDRLKKINLPTLVYRRARGDMIEIFKQLHMCDEEIPPSVILNKTVSRGHSLKILKQQSKKDVRKFYFTN